MLAPKPLCKDTRTRDSLIERVRVVTPSQVLSDVDVWIHDGRIAGLSPRTIPADVRRIDAAGLLLLPGFVDLHSDAVEKWIQPRPGGRFDITTAVIELDKHLASCGITTMYHCLSFGDSSCKNELRRGDATSRIARTIRQLDPHLCMRNRIHARFEIMEAEYASTIASLVREAQIQLVSFMDHTPGQGQFTSFDHFKTYYSQAMRMTEEEAVALAEKRMAARDTFDDSHMRELARLCRERAVPLASHDDDTPDKVAWVHGMGVTISEFPVQLAAARAAHDRGMGVLMGSPNILRGGSLTQNLSGREAIQDNCCSLMGSDYAPMSLLHAAFAVHREMGRSLPEAVRLLSHHPATAIGAEQEIGSIEEGLAADLVLVDNSGLRPRIRKTFVAGREVFSTCPP